MALNMWPGGIMPTDRPAGLRILREKCQRNRVELGYDYQQKTGGGVSNVAIVVGPGYSSTVIMAASQMLADLGSHQTAARLAKVAHGISHPDAISELMLVEAWCEQEIAKLERASTGDSADPASRQPVSANAAKLFPKGVPDNTNIVDLVVRLNTARGTDRSEISIAREFTGESEGQEPKARSLLSQIRRMRREGRIEK